MVSDVGVLLIKSSVQSDPIEFHRKTRELGMYPVDFCRFAADAT
jgi:hypothetical protein